jgi:probable F420-dependent oxidoreductase
MSEIRIGVQVQPQHATYANMRRAWAELDDLGADVIFTWDHFFPLTGDADGLHFESLALQAAMAEVTERAQIGALVMCNSYRNPQYLADALRTIDHISGGRLIAGLGAGWFERDYDEYGYEFGTAPDRLRALRRDLPRFKERLAKLNPAPVGAMPIMIGGTGEKVTLRLVAEHAQLWHGFGDLARYEAKRDILARHCADVGRDPDDLIHSWGIPQDRLENAEALADAGVRVLTASVGGGDDADYDLTGVKRVLRWRDERNAR